MSKKRIDDEPVRGWIHVIRPVDTERLYGPIPVAIKYMQEIQAEFGHHKDLTLLENWTGYEDMEMSFSFSRLETDEEFTSRLEQERKVREEQDRKRQVENLKKDKQKQIKALQKELDKLR